MVNVLIHTDSRYPVNRKIIRKACWETLVKNKAGSLSAEISLAVVGARKMKNLAQKYLEDDRKHEVLSFSFEDISQSSRGLSAGRQGFVNVPDDILRLGEVVLCWPQLLVEASRDEGMVDDKVYELTSHGVEHLLGIHHE